MLEKSDVSQISIAGLFQDLGSQASAMMTAVQNACVEKSTVVRVCVHQCNHFSCHITLVRNCQEQQYSLLCASYNLICVWMHCH